MKKVLCLFISILLLTGCGKLANTPIKKTEAFLKKYQSLDNAVLTDLSGVVEAEGIFNETQKTEYKDIMKKHYQNLTYDIKDETLDGDDAIVTVNITVTDFRKVLDEANQYLLEHPEEFNDEMGNYQASKFIDYRLAKMKETKDTVDYTIYISLTKVNGEWTVDPLDTSTYNKINGTYNY